MTNVMKHGMHGGHTHRGNVPDLHDDMHDMHDFLIPLKPGDPGPEALKKIRRPNNAVFLPEYATTFRRNERKIRAQMEVLAISTVLYSFRKARPLWEARW